MKFSKWIKNADRDLDEAIGKGYHNSEIFQKDKHKKELFSHYLNYKSYLSNRNLVIATWTLVTITLLVSIGTVYFSHRSLKISQESLEFQKQLQSPQVNFMINTLGLDDYSEVVREIIFPDYFNDTDYTFNFGVGVYNAGIDPVQFYGLRYWTLCGGGYMIGGFSTETDGEGEDILISGEYYRNDDLKIKIKFDGPMRNDLPCSIFIYALGDGFVKNKTVLLIPRDYNF